MILSSYAIASDLCGEPILDGSVGSSLSVDDVKSHHVNISSLNKIVSEISPTSGSWVLDPVRVALEFLHSMGAKHVLIRRCDDQGESARKTTITIVEDGYMDSSLRGTWCEFKLSKDESGRWIINEGREAYRCRRNHHQDSYSMNRCD